MPYVTGYRRVVLGVLAACLCAALVWASTGAPSAAGHRRRPRAAGHRLGRIRHVVVLLQENHSFDNVFGYWCARTGRCDGARFGWAGGRRIRLRRAPDIVPGVAHGGTAHRVAVDGGRMDGFDRLPGCGAAAAFACFTEYRPADIPNLSRLARHFALEDHLFESSGVPSWGSHLELAASTLDGFSGDNPVDPGRWPHLGWGCDSDMNALWRPSPRAPARLEPSCVPLPDGRGAYRTTPVRWVPTIMDRLDGAGLSWRLYTALPGAPGGGRHDGGYGWAICPTFADCLYSSERRNVVPDVDVIRDARAGALPNFAVVTPTTGVSQHNYFSMRAGDDYIGRVLAAIMHGPDWRSTAVFITYDDFGGFYDHVPPPRGGAAVRLPFVAVSPYARPGFVDHHAASLASILAFTEHTFGLRPLSALDRTAYDLRGAFDFSQRPVRPIRMTTTPLPAADRAYVAAHPPPPVVS